MSKRNSQRGQRGHTVGAPPKPINWPSTPFTIKLLKRDNRKVCELTLRNRIESQVETGEILELVSIKRPGGKVGAPRKQYVLKGNFDAATMALKGSDTATTVAVASVSPAVAPSVNVEAAREYVNNLDITPVPFVTPPAPQFASAPASPAPQSESNGTQTTVETISASEPVIG